MLPKAPSGGAPSAKTVAPHDAASTTLVNACVNGNGSDPYMPSVDCYIGSYTGTIRQDWGISFADADDDAAGRPDDGSTCGPISFTFAATGAASSSVTPSISPTPLQPCPKHVVSTVTTVVAVNANPTSGPQTVTILWSGTATETDPTNNLQNEPQSFLFQMVVHIGECAPGKSTTASSASSVDVGVAARRPNSRGRRPMVGIAGRPDFSVAPVLLGTPPGCDLEVYDIIQKSVLSDDKPHQTIVGKHVHLLVRVKDHPDATITSIQWTIPGDTVKSYTTGRASHIDMLSDTDLQAKEILFYWRASTGSSAVVTVQGTVGGKQLKATAKLEALAPTNVSMRSRTTTVRFGATPNFRQALSFGNDAAPDSVGIAFTFSAQAPRGGDGEIAGAQLISSRTCYTDIEAPPDAVPTCQGNPAFLLDNSFPVADSIHVSGGGSGTWTNNDSPQSGTQPFERTLSRSDGFRTYLVYKPSGADSIWVSLGRLDWSWAGSARREGDGRRARWIGPLQPAWTANPVGSATSELPQWPDTFVNTR